MNGWNLGRVGLVFIWALLMDGVGLAQSTTQVDLLLDAEAAVPGSVVRAGVRLRMKEGWHTYWRNPGDAGMATRVQWTLPAGVTAGPIEWPVPERLQQAEFVSFGYSDTVILLVPLTIDAGVAPGALELKAKVNWLECHEECIPGQAQISARLTVGPSRQASPMADVLTAAAGRLPPAQAAVGLSAYWEDRGTESERKLTITFDGFSEFDFFPFETKGPKFEAKSELLPPRGTTGRVRKVVSKDDGEWPKRLMGLVAPGGRASPSAFRLVDVEIAEKPAVAAGEASAAATPTAPLSWLTLAAKVFAAFVGGLILNIMPCVLPVLALKVLGFVNQGRKSPGRVRQLGLLYGLGVLVAFLTLALVAIGIQKAGGAANWNTPFQSPTFRMVLTVIILLVALNLFGIFEITLSAKANDTAVILTSKQGGAGAFFNGVLAALLATPCTAPFLASAVAFAFTQPPAVIALIFLSVGAGLAAPFVALCWNPVWLKLMPKPGQWMVQFKQLMGFPMLATVVWLFWLTAPRLGENGVLWFGLFLVAVATGAWVWGEFAQGYTPRPGLAGSIAAGIVILAYIATMEVQLDWRTPATARKKGLDWKVWSDDAVALARKERKPVLVDFTAQGCLNCQINKKTSIEIPSTRKLLAETGASVFKADYTDIDPAITEQLRKHGRSGVPMVLVYPRDPAKEPRLLPTLLTPSIVREALEWAAR